MKSISEEIDIIVDNLGDNLRDNLVDYLWDNLRVKIAENLRK